MISSDSLKLRIEQMMIVAAHTSACGLTADGVHVAWSDEGALREIHRRLSLLLADLPGGVELAPRTAVAMTDPAPQASVQIEQAAKGPPRVTVKAYAADIGMAATQAQSQYDALAAQYDRSEGLNAAATDMLDVLETITADDLGDGWGEDYIAAYQRGRDIVRRFCGSPSGKEAGGV